MTTLKDVQWTIPAPVRRLHRVINNIGLEDIFPALAHAPESELQEVLARYLHHGEDHAKLGIFKDFDPSTFPTDSGSAVFEGDVLSTKEREHALLNPTDPDTPDLGDVSEKRVGEKIALFEKKVASVSPISEVKNVDRRTKRTKRSALLEPYFGTLTMHEMFCLFDASKKIKLDEPPFDADDFLGCRFFFRFVAESFEKGKRVILMQDEKQSVAVFVHIKAIRRIGADPVGLLQVEYNCTAKTDRNINVLESAEDLRSFMQKYGPGATASIAGTDNQIYFVNEVLMAHERLLHKSVIAEHEKEWNTRYKYLRPSFIVPLRRISADDELHILQEIAGNVAPASEHAPSNPIAMEKDICRVCGKKAALKLCGRCRSVKYCTRECQVADWKSHKKSCKSIEPSRHDRPLSGASYLINPKQDVGFENFTTTIINRHDTPSNTKQAKLNEMPAHKDGEVYVIKAQAGPLGVLVYDRERSFTTTVVDPQEKGALTHAIRSVRAHYGLKAYLNAKNEDDKIRVYLEDLPEQNVNW